MHSTDSTDDTTSGDNALPEQQPCRPAAGTPGTAALNLPERYRVMEELGQGGMSRVYLALDDLLQKRVAIKILHTNAQSDPRNLMAFQREAKITAQLKHQNIVSVLDFGLTDTGQPYLVMDYVAGESLAKVLSRSGRISVADSLPLIYEILDAVKYAHEQGVLHRDLKPGNILIADNPDDNAAVKLIDFGIARFADPDQHDTGSGGIHGTPAYMSPEQAHGQTIDQRSEVYSLGCVLFSIWTACPPFYGDTVIEVLNQHCEKDPPRLGDMIVNENDSGSEDDAFPEELDQLISRCLAKDQNSRFQSASELEKELRKLDESQLLGATNNSGSKEPGRYSTTPSARRPRALAMAFATFIVAGLIAFVSLIDINNQDSQKTAHVETFENPYKSAKLEFLEELDLDQKWRIEIEEGLVAPTRSLVCQAGYPLKDSELKEIQGRTDYKKLKLRNHDLTGTGLRFVDNPRLTNLDIANASLTEEGWEALSEIKSPITDLDIGHCSTFNGTHLKYLLKLPKLVTVAIPLKNISPKDVAILSKHKSLRALTLCGKYSTNPDLIRGMVKLNNLVIIDFDETMLKPEDLRALQSRKVALGLSSIVVTPELMEEVAQLPIERLSLNSCETLELNSLLKLRNSKSLKEVYISKCPRINQFDVDTARKNLPATKITCLF